MSKEAAVFGLPFFMLAMQYLCTFLVFLEKKNRENLKNIRMVLWIVPVISILCRAVTYAYACGRKHTAWQEEHGLQEVF